MSKTWDIERITREGDALHGEIGSMPSKFDKPWLWRLMLGHRVLDSGRTEFRDEAVTDLLDAWDDWDERLDLPPSEWDRRDEIVLVDHPDNSDFWRHEPPKPSPCIDCGQDTPWIYLDLCYQHPECEFPSPRSDAHQDSEQPESA